VYLPVVVLTSALRVLGVLVPLFLVVLRLSFAGVTVLGTPRRLAVLGAGLDGRQADLETVAKGPPADRAFDKDGNPTKAAEGFARGKGVAVADLQIVEEGDKRYVSAVVREEGRPAAVVLAERLPELIASIKFQKSMRWNQTNIAYSRPLRWYVALFGPDVVPFMYAGVASGRTSQGLRPYGSPPIRIDDAANYADIMRENGLVIDVAERQAIIAKEATALAASKNGTIPDDADLLDEVTNLVERPTPLLGRFEEKFLKLPDEVLVAVMRKHQRYFPVYRDGRLLPLFITVRNGDDLHVDIVADGNEHVIRARFADAEFFYGKDSQKKLADFVAELDMLTFQFDLGSMLDKTHRLEKLVPALAGMLGLAEAETAIAQRAASLAKADLASNMVVEMTSLQGIMGGHYAKLSGEAEEVAAAIAGQYNAVSHTPAGLALALADRLDSLTGLAAAGLMPKGSNDPFALRRAALQIIENLIANKVHFDLREAIAAAAQLLPIPAGESVQDEVLGFVNGRLEGVLREKGFHSSVFILVVEGFEFFFRK
jgi:glycyl-tRNA synthetase